MDNLTHSLVGLAAAKAGLERLSPGATTMCVIAANAPDADIIALLGGRWAYLQHHRGITHSIIGTVAIAFLIPTLFWLGDHIIARFFRRHPTVKFRGMLLASLIVCATHPLLDWTNNYGIRPFLPWNSKWYYGDLVFIIDPWIWLLLGGACFLLTAKTKWKLASWSLLALVLTSAVVLVPMLRPGSIFPLASRVIWMLGIVAFCVAHFLRVATRWRSAIPIAALCLILAYLGGLSILHRLALKQAEAAAVRMVSSRGETLGRLAAMPVLANPLRWQCVFTTDHATYRFDLSLIQQQVIGETVRYERLTGTAIQAYSTASNDERARVFLGFARFPVARVSGDCATETLVQFADLRYTEPGGRRQGTFSLEVPIDCPNQSGALDTK